MLTVSRILHAGYQISTKHVQIWFDPILENPFSRNCYAFPNVKFDIEQIKTLKPDAIFISHFHDDHCSFESLNLLDRDIPIYMFSVHEEMFSLLRDLGFKNVFSLTHNTSIKLADLEVIPRRALDCDVDCLFQVRSNEINILNVVDSWIDDETLDLLVNEGPWDLICWPFQTMREVEVLSPQRYQTVAQSVPEEWLLQLKKLNPQILIPSSCQFKMEPWSWYNEAFFPISYAQFNSEIRQVLPDTQIYRLNPGRSIELKKNKHLEGSPLSWISAIGDQNVDYQYNQNVKPQTTAHIATHFTSLSQLEKERVVHFCESTILSRFSDLGPSPDAYFIKPHTWLLSIFNENGDEIKFFYQVEEDHLIRLTHAPLRVDWHTEVPEQKLFAALELGESLTSMYLRISTDNDDVDILEDPLIRCLFSEGFASYQKAQLKKIKS